MKDLWKQAALLALAAVLLTGCGGQPEPEPVPPETSVPAGPEEVIQPEPDRPSPAAPPLGEWGWADGTEQIHLILSEDTMAQLVHQDGTGQLLDLFHGAWRWDGAEYLGLELTADLRSGAWTEDASELAGTYRTEVTDAGLTLICEDGAAPLLPDCPEGVMEFLPLNVLLNGAPGEDEALLTAALDFYEARNGDRPGAARVDSRSDEGVSIQLYDDMGTHTATCAWYLVDPVTLTGTDEITGETIDLSPYTYG